MGTSNKIRVRAYLVRYSREVEIELEEPATVEDLLKKLGVNPADAVVLKDGVPLSSKERVHNGDKLQILPVSSGG